MTAFLAIYRSQEQQEIYCIVKRKYIALYGHAFFTYGHAFFTYELQFYTILKCIYQYV